MTWYLSLWQSISRFSSNYWPAQQGKAEMSESEHQQIQDDSDIVITDIPGSEQGVSPSFPPIFLLHRFGIILAANDAAHHYFPFLPLASAYERQLAQQL